MKKTLLWCSVLLLSTLSYADMSEYIHYGTEWRGATIEDEFNDWTLLDSAHTIMADFDNDGIEDIAKILLPTKSNKGFKVVSVVSNSPNNPKQFTLEYSDEIKAQNITIEEAKVSNEIWESACEKGYWDCKEDEIRKFKIRNPSIYLCYVESSCKVFMWSHKKQEFTEVILSD